MKTQQAIDASEELVRRIEKAVPNMRANHEDKSAFLDSPEGRDIERKIRAAHDQRHSAEQRINSLRGLLGAQGLGDPVNRDILTTIEPGNRL